METLKNKLKYLLVPFLIIFSLFNSFLFTEIAVPSPITISNSTINIIQDNHTIGLPKHFRKNSDKINNNINYAGLDKLNISGSAQFSESGLSLVKEKINTNFPIIIVDLRQESHGFVNGIPISWENKLNNANEGLSKEEVLENEQKKLNNIKIDAPLPISNDGTLIVKTVFDEKSLSEKNNLFYVRIPVTDGGLPTPTALKKFISFVNELPNDSHLHFHCKAGIGRTTTFMILYDIMKNCDNVPLNDIIIRQVELGQLSTNEYNDFTSGRRLDFFTNFYNQCKSKVLS